MYHPNLPRARDQRRTKEEPRNDQRNNRSSTREIRTPNHQKVLFIKIAVSFPSIIPSLIPPTDDRENTERTTAQLLAYKKCCFLRLLPKTVDCSPKKVDSFPKNVSFLCPLIPNGIRALHAFKL